MEHLALYRKYRPTTFEGVIGQDHIIKTLKNQVEKQEISHAYLFCGTRGTGKTSTAKILSKAINCKSPVNGSPCLQCEVCKALEDPSNLDVLEIDAASNNRVDEVRDLRDKIKYPPVNGKYKVYIIDEVHMLTDSAFNALLKTLEEPPAHAVFILATTEVHKLPATILSRVMRFDFKLVKLNELVKLVKTIFAKEKITADDESIKAICVQGEGSVRDTLSVADVCASYAQGHITYETVLSALGTTTSAILEQLSNAILNKDAGVLLKTIHTLFEEGKNFGVLAKDLTNHFRNVLLIKNIGNANEFLNLPQDVFQKMEAQSKLCQEYKLLSLMQTLSTMEGQLKYSKNERLLFETATLQCIYETNQLQNLQNRVEKLEQGKVQLPEKKLSNAPVEQHLIVDEEKTAPSNIVKPQAKKEQKQETKEQEKQVNLLQLWGQFLLSISPQTYPVLYTAVIDATPVKLEHEKLIIKAENELAKLTLSKAENKKVIETFFHKNNINVLVEVLYETQKPEQETIESALKQKFGAKLKIVE
jgi:DNA polymerase-3 subunit gamma/tau